MFGYVIPDRAGLSPEAQSRYRSAYCGLCRRIDALHGLRGRFSLSYDLTFLNILLCSLYEGEMKSMNTAMTLLQKRATPTTSSLLLTRQR